MLRGICKLLYIFLEYLNCKAICRMHTKTPGVYFADCYTRQRGHVVAPVEFWHGLPSVQCKTLGKSATWRPLVTSGISHRSQFAEFWVGDTWQSVDMWQAMVLRTLPSATLGNVWTRGMMWCSVLFQVPHSAKHGHVARCGVSRFAECPTRQSGDTWHLLFRLRAV